MTRLSCDQVQDRLPELSTARLAAADEADVRAHLETCDECAAALDVVNVLASAPRVAPPSGLDQRVIAAIHQDLRDRAGTGSAAIHSGPELVPDRDSGRARGWRVPSWGLAAAAGVVLALGTPLLVQRMQNSVPLGADSSWVSAGEVDGQVQDLLPSAYVGDDALIAGAPTFDALSDEALLALLDEMEG